MLPIFRSNLPSIMDEFFGKDLVPEVQSQTSVPAVNVIEGPDDFKIEVAAPGLDKKDFNIDVENNVLCISSEKEAKAENTEENYLRREFSYTQFKRSFTLPDSVHSEKITAKHKDGVLVISIPKRDEAKEKPARRIEIS